MGASRESYSLQMDLKYKNYKRFWKNIRTLLYLNTPSINYKDYRRWFVSNGKYERGLIIQDSFLSPFNKKFGCKWFGHDWKFIDNNNIEENYYVCLKCLKYETTEDHKSTSRDEKIDKILR